MTKQPEFYTNAVLVEQFDYTVVGEPQPISGSQPPVSSRILRTVAALATGALAMFGPVSATTPFDNPAPPVQQVVIHLKAPPVETPAAIPHVKIPDAQQRAADRFRRMFKTVPLSESEKLPDPDFGI